MLLTTKHFYLTILWLDEVIQVGVFCLFEIYKRRNKRMAEDGTVTLFLIINIHFHFFDELKFLKLKNGGSPYILLFLSQDIVNDLFEELKFVKQKNGQGGRGGGRRDPLTIYRSIFHPTPPSP